MTKETIAESETPKTAIIEQQIAIIDCSSYYVFIVAIAILLTIETLDIQRDQLVCAKKGNTDCGSSKDTLPYRAISSILTFASTSFFFNLSKSTYCDPANTPPTLKSKLNYASGFFVFVATLLRIFDLILPESLSSRN